MDIQAPCSSDAGKCLALRDKSRRGIKLTYDEHIFVCKMFNYYFDWFYQTSLPFINTSNSILQQLEEESNDNV